MNKGGEIQMSKKKIIPRNNKQYDYLSSEYIISDKNNMFSDYAKESNNLYNLAMYHKRQYFIKHNKILTYKQMNKMFKTKYEQRENMLYHKLPYVQSAQQVLKEIDTVWYAWFKALSAYKINPNKFTGKPRMPKYLSKGKRHSFKITNQNAPIKNGYLWIPKLKLRLKLQSNITKIQQVVLKPLMKNKFKVIVQYRTNKKIDYKPDNGKYIGIDPGINNAFTCVDSTMNHHPLIINGKVIKSINQYYNKRRSQLYKLHAKYNQNYRIIHTKQGLKKVYQESNATQKLIQWRNAKLHQFAHKATKCIIDYALNCDANTIVIGNNKNWKRSVKMGKKNNQNFVGIPHQKMIEMLTYKANLQGISVITTSEGYTSQTSFLDNEKPCYQNGNASRKAKGLVPFKRRIHRGLFKSNQNFLINADVNGAYQIIKKVFPKVISDGIVGTVSCPIKYSPLI